MLMLGLLAMMVVYLAAAQGSVMISLREMGMRQKAMDRSEATATLLAEARAALRRLQSTNEDSPMELALDDDTSLSQSFRRLGAEDPIYQTLPGVSPRSGDALVTIVLKRWEPADQGERKLLGEEVERYLISAGANRRGAVRVP